MTATATVAEGEAPPRGAAILSLVLGVIFLAALGVRIAALERPGRVISRDGIRYAKIARALAEGRTGEALANDYAPGFPATAAVVGRLTSATSDRDFARAAALAAALAGALSVVPAFALASRAAGARAGLLAATALALHPGHVAASSDALSEALLLLGALSSLAFGLAAAEVRAPSEIDEESMRKPGSQEELPVPSSRPLLVSWFPHRTDLLAALSGLMAGVAYLARPEGILVALGPLVMSGGRLRRALATGAALALLAAPYAAMASADLGKLALSKKKDAGALLSGAVAEPGRVLSDAGRNLGRAVESGQVAAVLGGIGLATAIAAGGARRRLAISLGTATLLLLAAQSAVRADPRFGLVISVLIAPLAGTALAEIAGRIEARLGRADAPAATAFLATLLLAIASVPGIARATRPDRAHFVDGARAIEVACAADDLPHPRVLAEDARIAHLAGDEGASDAWGRSRAARGDAAPPDVIVREEGTPPPEALRLRPIGRFAPPTGSRLPALVADRILGPE